MQEVYYLILENIINSLSYKIKYFSDEDLKNIEEITFYIGEPHWEEWSPLLKDKEDQYYLAITKNIGIK